MAERRLQRTVLHLAPQSRSAVGTNEVALIVGTGPGISAACARLFAEEGMMVAIAARSINKPVITDLIQKLGAERCKAFECDATDDTSVEKLFKNVSEAFGRFPDCVVYNASGRGGKGPFAELDVAQAKEGLMVTAFGGFVVGHHAAKGMIARGSGSILFTGASASYKGYAKSAPFAMGKFGLHGMAQAMARELGPKGVHVAHFPIDGGVGRLNEDGDKTSHWSTYKATTTDAKSGDGVDKLDTMLDPREIARTYLHVHRQHRSTWTFEVVLRPWGETW
jgi:NAD(P)-dependent dehydrogenase (short-subunit alcohol dehydrogenase family)